MHQTVLRSDGWYTTKPGIDWFPNALRRRWVVYIVATRVRLLRFPCAQPFFHEPQRLRLHCKNCRVYGASGRDQIGAMESIANLDRHRIGTLTGVEVGGDCSVSPRVA